MHAVGMSDLGEQEALHWGLTPPVPCGSLSPPPGWDLGPECRAIGGNHRLLGRQLGSRAALNPATGAEVLLKDVWRAAAL